MSKLGSETVATYFVDGIACDVVGCYDGETPENEFDFYDVFCDGECINLGDPLFELPDEQTVVELVRAHTTPD